MVPLLLNVLGAGVISAAVFLNRYVLQTTCMISSILSASILFTVDKAKIDGVRILYTEYKRYARHLRHRMLRNGHQSLS
jgi:hypothetical protein